MYSSITNLKSNFEMKSLASLTSSFKPTRKSVSIVSIIVRPTWRFLNNMITYLYHGENKSHKCWSDYSTRRNVRPLQLTRAHVYN